MGLGMGLHSFGRRQRGRRLLVPPKKYHHRPGQKVQACASFFACLPVRRSKSVGRSCMAQGIPTAHDISGRRGIVPRRLPRKRLLTYISSTTTYIVPRRTAYRMRTNRLSIRPHKWNGAGLSTSLPSSGKPTTTNHTLADGTDTTDPMTVLPGTQRCIVHGRKQPTGNKMRLHASWPASIHRT